MSDIRINRNGVWWDASHSEAFRALLTEPCETCFGLGVGDFGISNYIPVECPDCGGRGWLPKDKDGVTIHRNASTGYETAMFPAAWLEAEDDK